jgi:hypothetical protein
LSAGILKSTIMPPKSKQEERVIRLKKSSTGFKGHFTRELTLAGKNCQFARDTDNHTGAMAAEITAMQTSLRITYDKLNESLYALTDEDQENSEAYEEGLEESRDRFLKANMELLDTLKFIATPPLAAAAVQQAPGAGQAPAASYKIATHLKPGLVLDRKNTPTQLALWVDQLWVAACSPVPPPLSSHGSVST